MWRILKRSERPIEDVKKDEGIVEWEDGRVGIIGSKIKRGLCDGQQSSWNIEVKKKKDEVNKGRWRKVYATDWKQVIIINSIFVLV